MAIGAAAMWDDYQRVNVALDDVLGSPGLEGDRMVAGVASADAVATATTTPDRAAFVMASSNRGLQSAPFDAVAFLAGESGFLGATSGPAPSSGARVLSEVTSASGEHVRARQEIRGAELVGSTFTLHYQPGERDFCVTGRPVGDHQSRDPGPRPDVDPEVARERLRDEFGLPVNQRIDVDLVVFPVDGTGIWAFECKAPLGNLPVDLRAYLRADDAADILVTYNVAVSALHGEADVYEVNPRRTPELTTRAIFGIGPEPRDQLRGEAFLVRPHEGPPFANPHRDCRLQPGDAGFDEVQAWYHLGRAATYFRPLVRDGLFDSPPFLPLAATVRDRRAPNNAFFKPDLGELWFGDIGSNPTARSGDVVIHEFSHAVSDAICKLGRTIKNAPARGMNEGYADYFAASALDDPRIGDYVAGVDEGARRLDRPNSSLTAVAGEPEHQQGEVWASLLWALRGSIGASLTDLIAVESHHYLSSLSVYDDGTAALQRADKDLFPGPDGLGRHHAAIADAAAAHA